ncbi:MAG: hypothetical protein CMM50_01430 [Rhodospirillaceae bacterium]|nr:hypothetical protein [Rhodospirillaceae bacterium]|tara:strand:+ start:388 stop:1044 length:657 start_codon:yes stop_codon:yes gene_type:complete
MLACETAGEKSRTGMMVKTAMLGAVGALLLAGALPAAAADGDGNFAIDGAGTVTCDRFIEAYDGKTRDYYVYAGWVDGYVTATNQQQDETYDLTPWQTTEFLLDLVAQYCRANPKQKFIYGVTELLRYLYQGRLQELSEIAQIQHGSKGAYFYRATIQSVQEALAERSLFEGEADGVFDEEVAKSLARFQGLSGLPETGWLDQRTLFALTKVNREKDD